MSAVELPDIIYVVRAGRVNPELKYSLRSLANIPHRRVFIAGGPPDWLTGVTTIEVPKRQNRFDTVESNLRAALEHPELGSTFVYFNDDFYVTKQINEMPVLHGGPALSYRPRQELWMRYQTTLKRLNGRTDLVTYDGTHVPLLMVTEVARRWLPEVPSGCLWRTWVGNRAQLGGTQTRDVKHRKGRLNPDGAFLSSSPSAFREVRKYLEDVLPRKNPYVRNI